MPRITLLLGKRPKPGTLLHDVAERLSRAGPTVSLRLPHDETVDPADLRGQALIVQRGLNDDVAPLLDDAHAGSLTLCNPWPAEQLLRDRTAWRAALEDAGVPVPGATEVTGWDEVLGHAGRGAIVVKSLVGPGRGETVMPGTAESGVTWSGYAVGNLRASGWPGAIGDAQLSISFQSGWSLDAAVSTSRPV